MNTMQKRQVSYFVVFISGFVVMVLELLGSRILAPFIGNTIAVRTGLIGIILIALGLGYYVGGILADKNAKYSILLSIILSAAFFIFLIIPIKSFMLNKVSDLPYGVAGIIGSLALFLVPGTLLGMTTIYTIRLNLNELGAVGSINGTLYGISTAGSIIGVFATSMYLVPRLPTSMILGGLSILLALAATLVFLTAKKWGRR